MKIRILVSGQLHKKHLTSVSSNLSPRCDHVVLVSEHLDLTAVN